MELYGWGHDVIAVIDDGHTGYKICNMRRRTDERLKTFWLSVYIFVRKRELNSREKDPLGDRCKSTAGKGAIPECGSVAYEIA
jgi:hypothetical protein